MLKKVIGKFYSYPTILVVLIALITLGISIQVALIAPPKVFEANGPIYTHYNNFVIFKQSFFHLVQGTDLYRLYPNEHADFYKYSPTFALLMAPIATLPVFPGLLIWNLLNTVVLAIALLRLFKDDSRKFVLSFGIVLLELITSTQNSQSNALIAGLIILAYVMRKENRIGLSVLLLLITVFIKLFGVVAFAMYLLFPDKLKTAFYTLVWGMVLVLLPLLVIPPSELVFQYKSWFQLLKNDHDASLGLSVAGWIWTWFHVEAKSIVLITGMILFCIPFLKIRAYQQPAFQQLFLSSILVWIVIFNHKAESATFVIAVVGIAVWYFSGIQDRLSGLLLFLAIVFTVLSPTDLFPRFIRNQYVIPYTLKAVPCIMIWVKNIYDLIWFSSQPDKTARTA